MPTQNPPWPFVALANQLVGYLSQSEASDLNYNAGETVNVPLSPSQQVTDFVLKEPSGKAPRKYFAARRRHDSHQHNGAAR